MNEQQCNVTDNIPVLCDVVIPGILAVGGAPQTAPASATLERPLAERLRDHADVLMTAMQQRIERMIEEELALAHANALEAARSALQKRLRVDMEEYFNSVIAEALRPRDV